jgi:hypothetical protein
MQDAFAIALQLETHNRYPDCLRLELTPRPIPSDSSSARRFALEVSLEFNEQWQSLLGGRVKWGFRGGELRLELDGGVSFVKGSERSLSFLEMPLLHVSIQARSEREWIWGFRNESVLKGALTRFCLAELEVKESAEGLTATFGVTPADVSLSEAEGLWKHDISPNQHAVLDRTLALALGKARFAPYLSLAQWRSPQAPVQEKSVEEETLSLPALQALIEGISSAETEDFFALAAIAKLNPARDFAGGNLLGTSLNGLDLSGVNFAGTNLRGADLSDADLSEANLNGATLKGADLSGAYLGNANLRNADLHRASLALASLGGADLSGAKLLFVNLSNANLSSIKAEGAIFGDNPGLTEAIKLKLQQGGAIFQDN